MRPQHRLLETIVESAGNILAGALDKQIRCHAHEQHVASIASQSTIANQLLEYKGLLSQFSSRVVAFHSVLARISGTAVAGLFLSQAIYWTERSNDAGGWFYKTRKEWTDEIFLGRWEQEGVRRLLRDKGFIVEKRAGVSGRLYFRVDLTRVMDAIQKISPSSKRSCRQSERNLPTRRKETSQHVGEKPADNLAEKPPTSWRQSSRHYKEAEITTEITAKSTTEKTNENTAAASRLVLDSHDRKTRNQQPNSSAWESLPEFLKQALLKEMHKMSDEIGYPNRYGWNQERAAEYEREYVRRAAERAGIWPGVGEKLAAEVYQHALHQRPEQK